MWGRLMQERRLPQVFVQERSSGVVSHREVEFLKISLFQELAR
jgi:hypothetical protein